MVVVVAISSDFYLTTVCKGEIKGGSIVCELFLMMMMMLMCMIKS